jgi:hypothetical protein
MRPLKLSFGYNESQVKNKHQPAILVPIVAQLNTTLPIKFQRELSLKFGAAVVPDWILLVSPLLANFFSNLQKIRRKKKQKL